jgi:hypothetical protein
VLLALSLASACGSRLSANELVASDKRRGGSGTAGANATSGPSAAGTEGAGSGPGSGDATGVAGAGDSGGGRSGTAASTPSRAGFTAAPAAPAPAAGNGGATDVGVSGDVINLGTIETLTGPVPGLFRGAGIGVQACVAKTNAGGGLFGRQLKNQVVDDQFNENQARAAATKLVSSAFAFIGSASLYDGAMAAPMERAGMPDIGEALQDARRTSALNWSPQPNPPGWVTGGLSY